MGTASIVPAVGRPAEALPGHRPPARLGLSAGFEQEEGKVARLLATAVAGRDRGLDTGFGYSRPRHT